MIEAYKQRGGLDTGTRRRYWICIGVMAATFLFTVAILKPTPDVAEFAERIVSVDREGHVITPTMKLVATMSGAFLDYFLPSLAFVVITALWCISRKRFLTLVLPVGLLTALYSVVHGYPHHHGTLFVVTITGLWIAWPTAHDESHFDVGQRRLHQVLVVLILCVAAVNVWDAGVVIQREYKYPYSGAKDAANYLRSVGADRGQVFGLLFGVVAVQAEFERHLFANLPTSYFHLGLPEVGRQLNVEQLYRIHPEYVVTYTTDPDLMIKTGLPEFTSRGYEVVHVSDGYYLYKRSVWQREVYFILHHVESAPSQKTFEFEPIQ